ncbi:MAG: restriction endonuclease subunit S [Planctomycetes bacterium]|nr:restriction endonuclease subunit S [Planctomycetota bacterium]
MSDELPEGWAKAKLADVTTRVPNVKPESEPSREFAYVDISAVDRERNQIVEPSVRRFCGKDAPSRARRPIESGDVLFSNVRTNLRNVAAVPDPAPAQLCSNGFTVLRSNGAVLPLYLLRSVLTDEFTAAVSETQTGTHYPATTDAQVFDQAIRVPPLAEQHRIVAKVEALLEQVRRTKDRLDRVPLILKRFRQAVLAAACSGQLTEGWRRDRIVIEPATDVLRKIAAKRIELGLPSARRVLDTEGIALPETELPESWCWCRVGQIADVRLGGTPARKDASYWNGDVPWVSSGEVANCRIATTAERITVLGLENSNAKLYPPGTVLIAMIGEGKTRGQSAILDVLASTNQNVAGLVFDAAHVEAEYVWLWALSEYEKNRDAGRGGNQPALNGAKVRALPVPLPPLEEQQEIVLRVKRVLNLLDATERRVLQASRQANALPQAILCKAFAGELVPTEAELARAEGRDYETAEQLLERVRAQSEELTTKGKRPRPASPRGRSRSTSNT